MLINDDISVTDLNEEDFYTGPHVKTTTAKIIVNRYSDFGCA